MSQMIGMDETIELFEQLGDFLQDNDIEVVIDGDFPKRYTYAMNRLRYIQAREKGKEVKKTPKRYGGYFTNCGNCGSTIGEPYYRFCPNCGYLINREEKNNESDNQRAGRTGKGRNPYNHH